MLQERHSKCNVKIAVNKELAHFNYNVIWTLYEGHLRSSGNIATISRFFRAHTRETCCWKELSFV